MILCNLQEILVKAVRPTKNGSQTHLEYKAKPRGTAQFEYQLLAYRQFRTLRHLRTATKIANHNGKQW